MCHAIRNHGPDRLGQLPLAFSVAPKLIDTFRSPDDEVIGLPGGFVVDLEADRIRLLRHGSRL